MFEGNPRFEILRRVGVGGMGAVFEVFDRERQMAVALKVLAGNQGDGVLRFKREFRALQSVHHPNLVSLGELFAQGDSWFFTMELIRGVDLLTHVRVDAHEASSRRPRFDEARLRASFHQLGLGVAALHRAGHLHRDIKPSNVMVTTENRVVLLDFGLVREANGARDTSPDVVAGTPEYMSPEQALGTELTAASDWYAVGAVLYEALTGAPPFTGSPLKVMVDKQRLEPPLPSSVDPRVPSDLDSLCMALLRRDPARRPGEPEILGRLYVELRRDDRTYLTLPRHPKAERFVGRRDALSALHARVAIAARGECQLAFVTGAWGIGKSALVRELARQLTTDDQPPIVWSSRCYERETIPFKTVDMLMDDAARYLSRLASEEALQLLPPDSELLARAFPAIQRVPALAELQTARNYDELEPAERRALLSAGVRELIRRIAARRPVVLIVEDLQWADDEGLALLHEILRPPYDAAVAFVGTMRSDQPFLFAPAGFVDGIDPARVTTLHLDPLTELEVIDLVDALDVGADEARMQRVVQQAAGHPLFARELCLSPDTTAFRLEDALRGRIDPLPPAARLLLDVLAVAEVAVPQDLVAEAAGLAWAEAEPAIAHLRAAQLATTVGLRRNDLIEIAHDRVRQAVSQRLVLPARTHHRRLAETLGRWPRASPEMLAAHWLGAGERGLALDALLAG
ncbi:MAG: Serine/threonine-protein kinase PknA, partial [bacterium]|nr:Serine/threonine-protein kinase PknA [bacterium]